ncbi:MAG: hypothetical protein L6Q99_00260 [Planctomycetes bacterium]|nr:hypothetical protein [Planctomycetota bacterium]
MPARAEPRCAVEGNVATTTSIVLVAAAGTSAVAYALAPHGMALATTAAHLFTAAEGLRAGEGLMQSRGEAFVMWPPLMPCLLALGKSIGLGYPEAARVLGLAAHFAILVFAGLLVWRVGRSTLAAVGTTVWLAVTAKLFANSMIVRTDALFLALALGTVWLLVRYVDAPTRGRCLATFAAGALACQQRYPGLALVAACAAVVALWPRDVPTPRRLLRAVVGAGAAVAPLLARMLHNRWSQGSWGNLGVEAQRGVWDNVADALATLASYLAAGAERSPLGRAQIAVALALLGCATLRLARVEQRARTAAFFAFVPAYFAMVIAATSRSELDPIGTRYMLPLVPFLFGGVWLGALELDRRLAARSRTMRLAALTVVWACLGAHVASAATATFAHVRSARERGLGTYSVPRFARSELRRFLAERPLEGEVLSNTPEFVILAAGRRARYLPAEDPRDELLRAPLGAWVVWVRYTLDATEPPSLAGTGRALEPLAVVADGAVFRLVAAD